MVLLFRKAVYTRYITLQYQVLVRINYIILEYIIIRGASQDFIKKYPKNTDIFPILGTKSSSKIVQKGYNFIFSSLKMSLFQ
jgi:hypothetical protein